MKSTLHAGLIMAFLAGIVAWGGFNWAMQATNNGEFCISCHEMRNTVYQEYQQSVHFRNKTGVQASCPDCHVPKEWWHMLKRKIFASNELYHKLIGSIDTPEKFQQKRLQLAEKVWSDMRETDSRECRNCHHLQSMQLGNQTPRARIFHQFAPQWGKSCVDCHQGISHQLPNQFDREAHYNELHGLLEQAGVACYECHAEMARPPAGDGW